MSNTDLKILRSEIPAGGFGRRITSTEARDIRTAGYRVSNRAIVIQRGASALLGSIYNPAGNRSYANSGIAVSIR